MPSFSRAVLLLSLAFGSLAQNYVDDFSFGHRQGISPNSFAIPGWTMLGEGHVPQLLSDKVIVTPPYGGNKKGALWTESQNTLRDWQADFQFRVGATDRGFGSLQLWYIADGAKTVAADSIYTAGKFDGLALVIDTVAGMQKIRGFLNDGSTEYKTHSNVDSLAFGHCDYVYRNLGRPSRLSLKSTSSSLEVRIDDELCFSTTKAALPTNYNFGITAASQDPPDSFEVFKFGLLPATPSSPPPAAQQPLQNSAHTSRQVQPNQMPLGDLPASTFTSSQSQFENLHNRLNSLANSVSALFDLVSKQSSIAENNYASLSSRLPTTQQLNSLNNLASLDTKLSDLSRSVSSLERELKSSDHSTQFKKLSDQIQKNHESVTEHVPQRLREYVIAHTPRIGFILYSFMAFQTCCIGAWVWYKYRKSTLPKKYL